MLFLIGLGLCKGDISLNGVEALKSCEKVLLDRHTNFIQTDYIDEISKMSGKSVTPLSRSDLEERIKETIKDAKAGNISILVSGDPLVATTHHIIIEAAESLGIETKIIHASSIFSAAIGESGLDIYKFGRTTTITFWRDNYKPTSFLDVIGVNVANGMHTIALVDFDYTENRRMSLAEALELLRKAETEKKANLINEETKLIVMGNVGYANFSILYAKMRDLDAKTLGAFDNMIITLIIPAKMNFAEEEAVKRFSTK